MVFRSLFVAIVRYITRYAPPNCNKNHLEILIKICERYFLTAPKKKG
jgi:hypothetical protein